MIDAQEAFLAGVGLNPTGRIKCGAWPPSQRSRDLERTRLLVVNRSVAKRESERFDRKNPCPCILAVPAIAFKRICPD